jgi:hypothetical protein
MPRMGFEPTISVSKQAKTVHALDRAATVIGLNMTSDSLLHALSEMGPHILEDSQLYLMGLSYRGVSRVYTAQASLSRLLEVLLTIPSVSSSGLEVNTEKTKYILTSRCQNAGKNYKIKMANRPFENTEKVKYLGATATVKI